MTDANHTDHLLLAGDVGGTKTNLAIFSPEAGLRAPLVEMTLPSSEYPDFEALLQDFLSRIDHPVTRAAFGVAGPVVQGRATITNLGWEMHDAHIAGTFGFDMVHLLNDLVAIASGVPCLEEDDLHTLHVGEPQAGGAIAVIAPGTGLGEGYLTWDGSRYCANASEGGHTDFGPTDELQIGLLRYLLQRWDHVSYERVCAGIGIPNIYDYLKHVGYIPEPQWIAEQLTEADDPTPIIVEAARDAERPCALCRATLDLFITILGAETGNLAIKVLATGGVYLGGGIPPRILPELESDLFRDALLNKGRLADVLADIPVHVILNPKVALLGAAAHGFEM